MDKEFQKTISFLKTSGIEHVDIGVVLGTGLGDILNHLEILKIILYSDIPHFPVSTVEFHKGNLIYAKKGSTYLLLMQGRFHFYEGYSMAQIVYPIRIMKMMGVRQLFITNAAGGINKAFKKGDLVIIDDHINLQTGNPLIGPNNDALGSRFPDMCQPYDAHLITQIMLTANTDNIEIKKGVYAAVNGPNLETRAEYRYLKIIGADMVGMSTVPEVIAANHMLLPCAAISVITDECDPDNLKPIRIEEIIKVAGEADKTLSRLLLHTFLNIEHKKISHEAIL